MTRVFPTQRKLKFSSFVSISLKLCILYSIPCGRKMLKNSWVKESLSVKMQPKNTLSLRIERKIKKFLLNPLLI